MRNKVETERVLDRLSLNDQISDTHAKIDYLIYFSANQKPFALAHAEEVMASGGAVEYLDSEHRLLRVTADRAQIGELEAPVQTAITANTLIKPNPVVKSGAAPREATPEGLAEAESDEGQIAALLTARKNVGVDALLARFPEADGRGIKVAVIDSGIDFGIEGLSRDKNGEQKLMGFYDLTGFGKVSTIALPSTAPQETYSIGGKDLHVGAKIAAQKIQSYGVLSERELAKSYRAAAGVDLDGNGRIDDNFSFLVGINAEGKPAVWVDIHHDGLIRSREEQELTDFNQTYKYIDLRTDVAPSGARPLAVSIGETGEIQFHSIQSRHGTACGLIIAGDGYANGRLQGMAPKAKLIAYVLDATSQDGYTLDQFLKTFQHAKEQGVQAISVSWGFSTADLASARFVANYLDQEIASAGIVIGIAAGNEGPGIQSAAADDYIPHQGFAVGAMITRPQAENVYGWINDAEDSVIWYSSVGPSRGGRQIPDVVSPLMTYVRSDRNTKAPQFYPFGGTSSATPALIGASSSLLSLLVSQGEKIDARVFKLAVLNSAKPISSVEAIRQGAGALDVNAAYDLYRRLAFELKTAKADPSKRTSFPYELKISTPLENSPDQGEGIRFHGYRSSAELRISFSAESAAMIDALTTVEPILISHAEKFLDLPEVLPLQTSGGKLSVSFDPTLRDKPGVYSDVITLSRASDHLRLLQIPVVIEVPKESNPSETLLDINQRLSPFEIKRNFVRIGEPTRLVFEGIIEQITEGTGTSLGINIRDSRGLSVFNQVISLRRNIESLNLSSETLARGTYEIVLFRSFDKGAILNDLQVTGFFRFPAARVSGVEFSEGQIKLAVLSESDLHLARAKLVLRGKILSAELLREKDIALGEVFAGELELPSGTDHLKLGIGQSDFDLALQDALNMELTVLDAGTGDLLFRGWLDLDRSAMPLLEIPLAKKATRVKIIAYPNIVDWKEFGTKKLTLYAAVPFRETHSFEMKLEEVHHYSRGQIFPLVFDIKGSTSVDVDVYGSVELEDEQGLKIDSLIVQKLAQ